MGSFSINTNIASLQAQNYLRINQGFQNQTINEVTSGLRIVNSGDDAAGLAIANGYRSQEAVLTQGISNANDGLSQLQIADGTTSASCWTGPAPWPRNLLPAPSPATARFSTTNSRACWAKSIVKRS